VTSRVGSAGFIAALAGVAMTIYSWYSPWAWPAFPALWAIDLSFGQSAFADFSYGVRAAFVVVLMVWNTTAWAFIFLSVVRLIGFVARRGVDDTSSLRPIH